MKQDIEYPDASKEIAVAATPYMSDYTETIEFDSYLLSHLPATLTEALTPLFETLQPDTIDYKENGFQSRFRAFSSFRVEEDTFIPDRHLLKHFNRQKKFHTKGEGMQPVWLVNAQNISILQKLLKRITLAIPIQSDHYFYGINAIRVIADRDYMGAPAPGLHQDGYDFSCHLNIARKNVSGGMSILASDIRPETTKIQHELQPGEFLFFNDRQLYHTATAVTPMYIGLPTWRDMFIIDITHA